MRYVFTDDAVPVLRHNLPYVHLRTQADKIDSHAAKLPPQPRGVLELGEFAFGTNKGLTHFTNDILWDEKIYGTLHIAFGRAYPKYGGENKSAIHWDCVKEMRHEGEVTVDGQCVMRNGDLLFHQI